MKKIFLIIIVLVVGTMLLISYFVLRGGGNAGVDAPATIIDFSSLHPAIALPDTVTPDVATLLTGPVSLQLTAILDAVYRDNYHVFVCNQDPERGQVLILTARYDGSLARDGYDGAYQKIKAWESAAVSDVGHIIFPSLRTLTPEIKFVFFEPYQSTNPHISAARDFHKAVFYVRDIPDEMHYGWILNYLIFAPSQACLEDVMMGLYHSH